MSPIAESPSAKEMRQENDKVVQSLEAKIRSLEAKHKQADDAEKGQHENGNDKGRLYMLGADEAPNFAYTSMLKFHSPHERTQHQKAMETKSVELSMGAPLMMGPDQIQEFWARKAWQKWSIEDVLRQDAPLQPAIIAHHIGQWNEDAAATARMQMHCDHDKWEQISICRAPTKLCGASACAGCGIVTSCN